MLHEVPIPALRAQGDEFGKRRIACGFIGKERHRGLEHGATRDHGKRLAVRTRVELRCARIGEGMRAQR